MGLQLITEPSVDPVSLDEAKTHLRVTTEAEDGYIAGLILAARAVVEADTRRALITQSWRLTLDSWPPEQRYAPLATAPALGARLASGYHRWRPRIVLPRPPLQTVTSVQYVDAAGAVQTLAPSLYQVAKADTGEWYIEPAYNVIWPQTRIQLEAITVEFVCGYGDGPGAIPEPLRIAMLLLIGQWYDQRSAVPTVGGGTVEELPNAVQALVQRYRLLY